MKKSHMVIPLVILLYFTFGCQDKEAMAELEAMKAQAEVEQQNRELIRNYFKELDKGNAEIFREVFATDAAYYFPSGITEPMSLEQEIEQFKTFHNAIPNFAYNVEEIISVGDKVIVRFIARGTHTGEIEEMGIPATENKVEVSSIIIFRIENGKVVEERQDADMLGLMQQLGMELKPKEGEK